MLYPLPACLAWHDLLTETDNRLRDLHLLFSESLPMVSALVKNRMPYFAAMLQDFANNNSHNTTMVMPGPTCSLASMPSVIEEPCWLASDVA